MEHSGTFLRDAGIGATGRWALLIDGENVASHHAPAILTAHPEAFAIRRVYGDIAQLNGWSKVPELRIIHASVGHNSADILLAVEAMVLAQSGIRDFVIVTADGGLVHLIRQLREMGCRVVVMAHGKVSLALRVAGHSYVEMPEVAQPTSVGPASVMPSAPPQRPKLDDLLVATLRQAGLAGVPITQLNPLVHRELGIRISTLPEKNWRAYLTAAARKGRFVCDPKGPDARVRLAPPTP